MGVVPEIIGTGFVIEQFPAPGRAVEPGTRARLYLGVQPVTPLDVVPALRGRGAVTVAELALPDWFVGQMEDRRSE